ncbi:MAG TPA: glycoside hydrolase 43 family protein [Lachnospiraceae bacterium]|nr:glycoside hydrolase 43 family protein [Lachnospiraceae bacterium]
MENNPIIYSDFPDPDVIRVDDTYYMISTTMHFMPGGVILRSYDLVHWEIFTYVYDSLDDTPGQRLEGAAAVYGKGMWAATLRRHKGIFYVCFVANDTKKTYLYTSKDITGPWKKQNIEGFYHDCSLLFDDDDRIYIVYGNAEIKLTELKADLSGPKPDGLHRTIIKDSPGVRLGYEGSHIYKMNGIYYVFLIHWLADGSKRRVEACFCAKSLEGEFTGGDVFDDDIGFQNAGVAQGGIVDTPDGDWYAMLFQDHGAVGRIPVLLPIRWENGFPIFGADKKTPLYIEPKSTRPDYKYRPLTGDDAFDYEPDENGTVHLKEFWQWNHTPDNSLWSMTEKPGAFRLYSDKLCVNIVQAKNTLTQRMTGPACEMIVTVDGSGLKDGDYAGICALQGCYGFIALTKASGKNYLVMTAKEMDPQESTWGEPGGDQKPGKEFERLPVTDDRITLKIRADFKDGIDEAEFYYLDKTKWNKLGITHKLYFRLDHFVGCRVGLFLYSTMAAGGRADFDHFAYRTEGA